MGTKVFQEKGKIKKSDLIKAFIIYLIKEPFIELRDFIKEIPAFFNKPSLMLMVVMIFFVVSLFSPNKRAKWVLFVSMIVCFIWKKWKGGEFRRGLKDRLIPP